MTIAKPKPQGPDDPNLPLDRWPEKRRKIPYGVIPNGYRVDENDGCLLLPDPETIFWIEKAFDYLQSGNALRETSEWLSQKTHRAITHQTLSNIYKKHRKPFTFTKTNKRSGPKISADSKKLISEKAKARAAVRRMEKVEQEIREKQKKLQEKDWDEPRAIPEKKEPPVFTESERQSSINILFRPNPGPQTEFLRATELEVLYGGAAGGGKSYAMIADPMRYFHNGNFVGLLLRRTNDELRELVRETQKLYPRVFPGAKWHQQKSSWTFPSGAEFWITYLDRDDDVLRYQGQAFCWIGMDELTQYPTPYAYEYLKSRLRSSDPVLSKNLAMRATTNPGGPGHNWVKQYFVDPAIPGNPFWGVYVEGPQKGDVICFPENHRDPELRGKPISKRLFIPARLSDNPYLFDDGTYERNLLSLPEATKRKLLDGDWSVMEGAAFSEFDPRYHVIPSEEIPRDWMRFRAADFGYSSHSAVLWFAIEPGSGILHVYRELYVSKKTGAELADLILEAEAQERVQYGVLDSSVWHQRGHNGPSIAEEMIARGCRWRQADRTSGSRIAGKNRLHELLKIDPYLERPAIVFHENCRQIIADLPMIPMDPDGGEDIDDKYSSDHTYDALRYGIMSRPKTNIWGEWWDERKPTKKYKPVDGTFGY